MAYGSGLREGGDTLRVGDALIVWPAVDARKLDSCSGIGTWTPEGTGL